jgi:hypothetical protein
MQCPVSCPFDPCSSPAYGYPLPRGRNISLVKTSDGQQTSVREEVPCQDSASKLLALWPVFILSVKCVAAAGSGFGYDMAITSELVREACLLHASLSDTASPP